MTTSSSRTPRVELALALLPVLFVLFFFNSLARTRQFPYDAMNYVDVARHVVQGDGLVQTTVGEFQPQVAVLPAEGPVAFVAQGPLYPLLIAGVAKLGIAVEDAALLLSLLGYGVILILGQVLSGRFFGSAAARLTLAALLIYAPLTQAGRTALSEAVALALLLGSVVLLCPRGTSLSRRAALAAGGLMGLAFDTRYALLWFVPLGALWLLRYGRGPVLAYLLGVGAAMLPVLLHNRLAAGVFLPQPLPSERGLFANTGDALWALLGNVVQTERFPLPQALAVGVFLAVVLWRRALRLPRQASLLWLWPLVYTVGLILQRSRVHFDPLDFRLLLPAGLFLVIGLGGLQPSRRVARAVLLIALLVALGREGKIFLTPVEAPAVVRSPRLAWLAQNTQTTDRIVGDDTLDIPFFLGHTRVFSVSAYPYNAWLEPEKLRQLARCYVVVRVPDDQAATRFGPLLAALKKGEIPPGLGITLRATLSDARIYAVTDAAPSAPPRVPR